jgi:hypothetical protein
MSAPAVDGRSVEATIRDYMSSIKPTGEVTELRAFEVSVPGKAYCKTVTGYFDNVIDLAREAASLDGYAKGIYFTLNPLKPELIERSPNKLMRAGRGDCATDADVIRVKWIPLDFDPIRPQRIMDDGSALPTNSNEEELSAAFDVCDRVMKHLIEHGWRRPIPGLSGNGWHLLLHADLEPGDPKVASTIQAIATSFSTERVIVDTSVSNPSRIWKLYGTLACKAPDTPKRPQRRSLIFGPREVLR